MSEDKSLQPKRENIRVKRDRRMVSKPNDMRKSIKQVLSLLKDYKLKLIITFICALISTAFTVVGPLLIGQATTVIFDGLNKIMNGTGTINLTTLFNLLILATVLYVISAVFTYLQSWFLTQISTSVSYTIRKKLIEKVNQLSMKDFDKNKRGDILSRITNDVDTLQTGITSTFIQLMTAVITIIGVFIMMMSINITLTIITIVLVPLSFIIISFIMKRSQKYYKDQLVYKGMINAQIEESFGGHDIIRTFNQEESSIETFKKDNSKWYDFEWKSQFYSSLMGPVINFISNLSYVIIAVLGAILVLERTIAVGDILAFFQYIQNFTQPIQQITRVMNLVQSALAATERIFEFLDIEVEKDKSTKEITDIYDEIEFKNVEFGYDETPVIKDLTFTAKKGEKIAIVGHTGAGKTTIVKLLMRFYDITNGEIKIDGINIEEYNKNSLRSLIGIVQQDTWLFSDTIKENIKYGNLNASDEDIERAAQIAYADNFIKQLPEGYNTVLNEDTDNISIGQKQLLTIARTLLSDKKILVLDEATSSIDTRTEKLIQEAMDRLMENRTSFIIAHRLSTVKNADMIIVMDDGRIIEKGTHNELMEKVDGYYKSLYQQFESEGEVS